MKRWTIFFLLVVLVNVVIAVEKRMVITDPVQAVEVNQLGSQLAADVTQAIRDLRNSMAMPIEAGVTGYFRQRIGSTLVISDTVFLDRDSTNQFVYLPEKFAGSSFNVIIRPIPADSAMQTVVNLWKTDWWTDSSFYIKKEAGMAAAIFIAQGLAP